MIKINNNLWKLIISVLNKYDYVILRNYEKLPLFENDIDILIDRNDFKSLLCELIEKLKNIEVILLRIGFHSCFSCYFFDIKTNQFYHIDLFTALRWKQFTYLNEQDVLDNREEYNGFFIPAPEYEFCEILLTRLIYHKKVKEKYWPRIKFLAEKYKPEIEASLTKNYNRKFAQLILNCTKADSTKLLNENAQHIRWFIIKENFKKPFAFVSNSIGYLLRLIKRIIKPEGLFVVLVGPDGSGKSTVSNELINALAKLYRYKHIFHWRPFFLEKQISKRMTSSSQTVENPHALPAYNQFVSFMKLVYYMMDFVLGYIFHWLPLKIKSSLVITERYYYDFYIDQKRYRMNLPKWIYRFFEIFIPKPDLLIYLSSNPEITYARKAELDKEEVIRQQENILEILSKKRNFLEVNNNNSLDSTVFTIQRAIIQLLSEKYERKN